MADTYDYTPPSLDQDDQSNAEILRGLMSPADAQALVAPPPDAPPPTQPGQTTALTGNLASAPTQATPKHAHALAEENAALATRHRDQLTTGPHSRIRRGLAAHFSKGPFKKENQSQPDQTRAILLHRGLPRVQPSPRATGAASPVNQKFSKDLGEPVKRQMQPLGTIADDGKRKVLRTQATLSIPDRSRDSRYVKVQSKGQIGYLPKSNLQRARQRDRALKVLGG